jgi:signal transduction histidine kinase
MKILKKSALYVLWAAAVVFAISAVVIYFQIRIIIFSEIDDLLRIQRQKLKWNIEATGGFEHYQLPIDSTVSFSKVNNEPANFAVFGDTTFVDPFENEKEPFRFIRYRESIRGEERIVTIAISAVDSADIIEIVTYSLLIILLIVIATITTFQYYGMKHIWQPFWKMLKQVRHYDFRSKTSFESVHSDIEEFTELNNALTEMTSKLHNDYVLLKQFNENASHEMQTPLSIILSKIELLLEEKNFEEKTLMQLHVIYKAAYRLSRLQSDMSLLHKIENMEFSNFETIDLNELVRHQLEEMDDLFKAMQLDIQVNTTQPIRINGNAFLIEIMLSNLLSNALKHNIENGFIHIDLLPDAIIIVNSGKPLAVESSLLFERFKKGNPAAQSSGLGLAIVKQICELHNFEIHYHYQEKKHSIHLSF